MRKRWLHTPGVGAAAMLSLALLLAGCFGGGGPASPVPRLAVDATSLDFGFDLDVLTFHIRNAGGNTLTWSVEATASWVSVAPADGTGDGAVAVTVDRSGLDAGFYAANVAVTSNGGSAGVLVTMTVTEGDEGPPSDRAPGQVQGLLATGWTLPTGVAPMGTDGLGPSATARRLTALAEAFAEVGGSAAPPRALTPSAMPAGYEGAFVLSWDAVEGATAYRVFMNAGSGWAPAATVAVGDLDDASQPTYMLQGSFDVGAEADFIVQALNGATAGPASDPRSAFIIGPQTLQTPARNSSVGAKPTFRWAQHAAASGYALYVTFGGPGDEAWIQVLDSADATSVRYPGDDDSFGESLELGRYAWFVLTQGPGAGAYALSQAWEFHVAP